MRLAMRPVGEIHVLDVTGTASPHFDPEDLRVIADFPVEPSLRFVIHLPSVRHLNGTRLGSLMMVLLKIRPFTTQDSIPVVTDSEDVHRVLATPDCLAGITSFPPFAVESDAVAFARYRGQVNGEIQHTYNGLARYDELADPKYTDTGGIFDIMAVTVIRTHLAA